MKSRNLAIFVSVLGIGGVLGMVTGGGVIHVLISRLLCMLVVAPGLVLLTVAGIEEFRKRDQPKVMDGLTLGTAILVLAILGFTGGGSAILHYRKAEVRRFVDEVLPLLDEHKKKSGKYPRNLEEVTDRKIPYYLRGPGHYTTNGFTFTFYFVSADSAISGVMLTDSHRTWSRAD